MLCGEETGWTAKHSMGLRAMVGRLALETHPATPIFHDAGVDANLCRVLYLAMQQKGNGFAILVGDNDGHSS